MRFILILAALALFCGGCSNRDDQKAMANLWHMGVALQKGADPVRVGASIQKLAEAHEKAHEYTIDKSGATYVRPSPP